MHRRCHGQFLRFVSPINASDRQDTRHALASKPARSTEWQLGTLNGLVGVVVSITVGASARTYEQRMDRRMRRTKIRQGDALEVPSSYYNLNYNGTYKYKSIEILYL